MTLKDILEVFATNKGFLVVLILTIVQITPIKINPWSFIFKWIGEKTTGHLSQKIDTLQAEINIVKREFELKNANDWRWDILDFFNSARNGRPHSKEEWDHAIDQVKKYERHVEIHGIDNGVLEEASKWLRSEYQKHLVENDFLDTQNR